MSGFKRVTKNLLRTVKKIAEYYPDVSTCTLQSEIMTVLAQTKVVIFELSKDCTSRRKAKWQRRQQLEQRPPQTHKLWVSVLPIPQKADINVFLDYLEYLMHILFNLIKTRTSYKSNLCSEVYSECYFFESLFYLPTMHAIHMLRAPREGAFTSASPLMASRQHVDSATSSTAVAPNDFRQSEEAASATTTSYRQTNTATQADDVSAAYEDVSCTSTTDMFRPIFDMQDFSKRRAPDGIESHDKPVFPLNGFRPQTSDVEL